MSNNYFISVTPPGTSRLFFDNKNKLYRNGRKDNQHMHGNRSVLHTNDLQVISRVSLRSDNRG